jgi:hypothetical protein
MRKFSTISLLFLCVACSQLRIDKSNLSSSEPVYEDETRYRTMSISRTELERVKDDGTSISQPLFFSMHYKLKRLLSRNVVTLEAYHYKGAEVNMTKLPVTQHDKDFDKKLPVDMSLNSFRMSRESLLKLLSGNGSINTFFFVPEQFGTSVRYIISKAIPGRNGLVPKTDETGFYLNPSPPAPPRFE